MIPIELAGVSEEPKGTTKATEGAPASTASTTPPPACTGAELDELAATLAGCEVPMPKASELPTGMKAKLEIALETQKSSVAAGGHVDVTLTLKNKHGEPLSLFFTGDPSPRFELEALDTKGRRVDRPAGKPPARSDAKTRDAKASRITLLPGGVARMRLGWDAVKTRWATSIPKGWEGHGHPTAPAGPLPKGKYTLRAAIPLLGVFERGDVEPPKLVVDVGG
jgi:hypothetical protein